MSVTIIRLAVAIAGVLCLSLSCTYALLALVALAWRKRERPHQCHDVLMISDSDACVGPDYLSTTAPLQDETTGLVTRLCYSVSAGARWSRLGAMYVNEWYMPSVLLARLFGNQEFAVLSWYVTTAQQYDPSLGELIRHETRWMRTIRALRPRSFPFLFITFSLPLATVGFALSAAEESCSATGLVLFLICVNARFILHRLSRRPDDARGRSGLWLLPLRDSLICWVWCRAFLTSRVTWRGAEFEVDVHGVMRGGQL